MSKLKALNISLCLFNNAIFIIRLGQILSFSNTDFWNIECEINEDLAGINQRINANQDKFIVSGLKRDNNHCVNKIKSFYLNTTTAFGICLISTAASYFAANKSITTIVNLGLVGVNVLYIALVGKFFPKQGNSYEFVETTDSAADAKRFYYHLSSKTLLSRQRTLNKLNVKGYNTIVYDYMSTDNGIDETCNVILLDNQNNESKFKASLRSDVDGSYTACGVFDKLTCIMDDNTYRKLSNEEKSSFQR